MVTVSHTAVATVAAIELAGAARSWWISIPSTFTIELRPPGRGAAHAAARAQLCRCIYTDIRPILPAIVELARRYATTVIEDCAQSHGAPIGNRKTGSFGAAAAFSFYPTKNLGALGDGGAIATNDRGIAERARLLREYGWKARYVSEVPGMNSRLDELQAAILRVKLRIWTRKTRGGVRSRRRIQRDSAIQGFGSQARPRRDACLSSICDPFAGSR